MNPYLVAIVLGIIEGITEFLPVSSTAHMRIVEPWLGLELQAGYWKMFTIVIQLGAILSVVWLFWRRALKLWKTFPEGDLKDRNWLTHPLSLVMLSFVITAGPSYLADKYISRNLENLVMMGLALVAGGVVMWVVDVVFRRPRTMCMEGMTVLDAAWIGVVQILSAVFPGTSRSMCTIAAGQTVGLSRSVALEFSFFVSIPTMFAATGFKLLQALVHKPWADPNVKWAAPEHQWAVLAMGFIVSFIVALAVNAWFIAWVRRRGFVPFAVYRLLIGTAVLIWAWKGVP